MNVCKKIVVTAGCLGVLFGVAGCANKDIVKSDESIAGNQATVKEIAVPVENKALNTAEAVKSEPVVAAKAAAPAEQAVNSATAQSAFEKIYFNFDNSDLSQAARNTLSRNAEILLKAQSAARLKIEGHCDERGSAEYNLALGERRAKAAQKYLTTMGVQPERLAIVSYGKERPAVQGNNESAWAKNRRDEFIIQ